MKTLSRFRPRKPHIAADLKDPRGRSRARREMLWNDHGFLRVWFTNLHQISDEMWRCNQPQPHHLKALKAKTGVRTIINLRGRSTKGYYLLEEEMCEALGIELVNFKVYSREAPSPETIHNARRLFSEITYPAVMHCKSGADRAGIMSALYLVLHKGLPVREAKRQLSLKYLHIRQGKTGILDFYLERYLEAEAETGIKFEDWATRPENISDMKSLFLGR